MTEKESVGCGSSGQTPRTPEQAGLRRAFTVWFRRVFLPRRLPGVDLANMEPGEALLDCPDGVARVQAPGARGGA